MAKENGAVGRVPRILIVEDEFLIALTLEDILLRAGLEVAGSAAGFEEALALAGDGRTDLVLMDIRLASKRDGVDAAIEIRRRFGVRSLFTSANMDPQTVERAKAAEPAGWVPKPYAPETLLAAVRAALEGAEGRK